MINDAPPKVSLEIGHLVQIDHPTQFKSMTPVLTYKRGHQFQITQDRLKQGLFVLTNSKKLIEPSACDPANTPAGKLSTYARSADLATP